MDNGQKENSDSFISFFRRLPEYVRVCLTSTFLFGLLAHGMALTNKFAVVDELYYGFNVGSTVASGRWFLEILGGFVRWLFGSPNFSLPLTGGLLTIFFTALCSCVLVDWLELKRKHSWILVSGLMITFPVMSGMFFYNFTAPYYMVALLMLFLGARLLCRKRGILPFLGGVTLLLLSISVYQAFIPVLLGLLLTYFIREVITADPWNGKTLLREALWYCGAVILMIVLYFLSIRVSTGLMHQALTPHKGISSMGGATLGEYLHRVKLAYYLFLFPSRSVRDAFIFPYRLLDCYYLTLVFLAVLGTIAVLRMFRENRLKVFTLVLAFVCFPLAVNFVYVMCAEQVVYSMTQFGLLCPFLLLACLSDWQFSGRRIHIFTRRAAAILLCVFCLFSVRVDNAVYTKGLFVQGRAQSYFTALVAQIKGTPGYTADTPVVYLGTEYGMDPTFHRIDGFGALAIAPLPHDASPFCISFHFEDFLHIWCGFEPPMASPENFVDLPEVQAMPCYPDAGSIQIVNGTLVVKFWEQPQ